MFLQRALPYAWLLAAVAHAQSSSTGTTTSDSSSASSSSSLPSGADLLTGLSSGEINENGTPTGRYVTYSTTLTLSGNHRVTTVGTMTNSASSMAHNNGTTTSTVAPPENPQTVLSGKSQTTSAINGTSSNSTASSTSTSAQPTNTTPCNNYAEFCSRKYSNITMVAAHNSPFHVPGNAASNQAYDVTTQLNDGVRLVQGQAHTLNGTIHLCHGSCSILDAGPIQNWLFDINNWVATHPYDVVTVLIGNGDYKSVSNYVAPLEQSGITNYAYIPSKIPMSLDDWPTLASMILTGQRVVIFMDYEADQTTVPFILDEFSQMWETPFDPTNRAFPCTIQRPPDLSPADAKNRLYMTNHNLNTEVSLLGNSILIPTLPLLNVTNNVTGFGSLGAGALECASNYDRAPNFLNVDYYNVGNGSVFQVAATWNNVTYSRKCCGLPANGAERSRDIVGRGWLLMGVLVVGASWLVM